ncbi:MAG: uridine kinase [Defluviitaleaceae bacterium]|nr:uridine kinase [Defluviitaleaceae bacterium]MCL2273678.1 uridine kinase [Defluviitaleaceae bacterium]
MTNIFDNLRKIAQSLEALEAGRGRIVAIDGRCCAGKSTLAAKMREAFCAGIIHMDDFFLPAELRTPQRYAQAGGNIHHERFAEEVIPFLHTGEGFSYRIFDCKKMDYNGVRQVAPSLLRVIEGAYSHHPVLGDYMSIRAFYDVETQIQRERIIKRNGEEAAALFFAKWIPLEEEYLRVYKIQENAHVTL